MRIVWGTRSRAGSQFLLKLTVALMGKRTEPQSRINGARKEGMKVERSPSLAECVAHGNPTEYFRRNGIAALKLEEPAKDDWGAIIAREFPDALWLGNYRHIGKIVRSHFNLKWGFEEAEVVRLARLTLSFYQSLRAKGRLFMVSVDERSRFDLEAFASFLGAEVSTAALRIVEDWPVVNDLAHLRSLSGLAAEGVATPPGIDTLFERYSDLQDVEQLYRNLCNNGLERS